MANEILTPQLCECSFDPEYNRVEFCPKHAAVDTLIAVVQSFLDLEEVKANFQAIDCSCDTCKAVSAARAALEEAGVE